jgi:acyl-CoA thioesterase-1
MRRNKQHPHLVADIRLLLCVACLLLFFGCDESPQTEEVQPEKIVYEGVITAMGDSLTAGLGVAPSESYPAVLERMLAAAGLNYRVINSGVSGETSSGARSRVDWVLKSNPDIVILETGANDGLRGIAPELIKNNIGEIIEILLSREITIVLTGMQMTTNLGTEYRQKFNRVYHDLAVRYSLIFMPFFLQDVAAEPGLNQTDGIHPTAEGYQVIAANVLPFVKEAIGKRSVPVR